MDLLLLPGNSPRNSDWLVEAQAALSPLFGKTVAHTYQHWGSGQPVIDFKTELEALDKKIDELGKYIIVAKSVGTVLSILGMKDATLEPETCIFAGMPLKLIVQEGIDVAELMGGINTPTILLQNTDDPAGSYSQVKEYLSGAADNLAMVEMPGSTHDYSNFELLSRLAQKFITAN